MRVRIAEEKDIKQIQKLLIQVQDIHHKGRPDLFKADTQKYKDIELKEILSDTQRPILVAVDESDNILGYVFYIIQQHLNNHILTDIKTLYIDDLCIDETQRGKHLGKKLYEAVIELARKYCCYNITLNVWSCNQSALKFYEICGFKLQKIGMEIIL